MKLITLIFTFFIAFGSAWTQENKPEKVHSFVKVYKTFEWYATQYNLWEKVVEKNKKNPEAWTNYYAAARMAKIVSSDEDKRNIWYEKMEKVVEKSGKSIAGTYEHYYILSWHSDIWNIETDTDFKRIANYAESAYKLDPNRTEIYPDLMNLSILKNNQKKLKEMSVKWQNSGDISPNLLAINYNMLMSTEPNSILLTAGDNDTYPTLVLQNANNIRTDVTVINIFIARFSEEYRNNVFDILGIPHLQGKNIEQKDIINHIIKHKETRPLYFAFGDYFSQQEMLKEKLYNVGMAMRYSDVSFNNTSMLINNFENKFLIDQLKFSLVNEEFPEQVKRHNFSYLPSLMLMFEHYKLMENERKMKATKQLIIKIVEGTTHEKDIKEILTKH